MKNHFTFRQFILESFIFLKTIHLHPIIEQLEIIQILETAIEQRPSFHETLTWRSDQECAKETVVCIHISYPSPRCAHHCNDVTSF